jgi:hypothetical protein
MRMTFQPTVASKVPRHLTDYRIHDRRDRFQTAFTADVQCNRKWNGAWNHPRDQLKTLQVTAEASVLHRGTFRAHMSIDLPARWSC